jgi:hypothetical protein
MAARLRRARDQGRAKGKSGLALLNVTGRSAGRRASFPCVAVRVPSAVASRVPIRSPRGAPDFGILAAPWIGTPRLGINFSHPTLHFMHFMVEFRGKDFTKVFVQGPEFVDAHPGEISTLHISSPGLASNNGREAGKTAAEATLRHPALNFPANNPPAQLSRANRQLVQALNRKVKDFDLFG